MLSLNNWDRQLVILNDSQITVLRVAYRQLLLCVHFHQRTCVYDISLKPFQFFKSGYYLLWKRIHWNYHQKTCHFDLPVPEIILSDTPADISATQFPSASICKYLILYDFRAKKKLFLLWSDSKLVYDILKISTSRKCTFFESSSKLLTFFEASPPPENLYQFSLKYK